MARLGTTSRPGRALFALVALLAVLYGSVAAGAAASKASWTPKLALDLEGGTEIILTPKPQAGETGTITKTQINEAVNIIRQRVNGSGVSEAEVSTEGSNNIVVSLPGTPDKKTIALVEQSAALTFRPVLVEGSGAPVPAATPTSTAAPSPSATGAAGKSHAKAPSSPAATSSAKATSTPSATNGRLLPQALTKAVATSSTGAPTTQPAAPVATAPPAAAPTGASATKGTASDLSQITPAIQKEYTALQCTQLTALQSQPESPNKPLVTCSQDGLAKYILGRVEVQGTHISDASADIAKNSQGFSTGQWEVVLNFDGTGTKEFADVTDRLTTLTQPQNEFAIVLDRLVVSAPRTDSRIPNGQAQITGNFTQDSATQLASQLKFGALPVSFVVQTQNQISATLGSEQLQRGLLAGLIGLVLVVIYSLLQYRALGFVTILSLVIAASFTYGMVLLLGWTQGYRLSLSGVTGLIVAIGITADSFIVYFERVRDEVREGRALHSAVEAAWLRARRTILASDAVSFLAALVLYALAVGGVRGFAFTLGLTTLIDVLVVFLFTKPTVTLLSRTTFFGGGHPLSGFSAEQLGRAVPSYAGRGRVRNPGETIAARRAAQLAAQQGDLGSDDDDPGGGGAGVGGTTGTGAGAAKGSGTTNGRVSARSSGNRRDA